MRTKLFQDSMMVSVPGGSQLHIRHIYQADAERGDPVLLVHGDVEDGHIFYSNSGHGLAPLLADRGYDVYVVDMRGKGKSWPTIGPASDHGYHEAINVDLPAIIRRVAEKTHNKPQIWIAHSMGGALLMSYFARYGDTAAPVKQIVHFGSRRIIQSDTRKKRLLVDWVWQRFCRWAVSASGYLPAKGLRLGPANETAKSYFDSIQWMSSLEWLDPDDAFDYRAAIHTRKVPKSLYFSVAKDTAFGAPEDVRYFMRELGSHDGRMLVLSREGGNARDYSHVGMLVHIDAEHDHFPILLDWLAENAIS